MSQVLINWREECDAIHTEMDRLLATGRLQTAEERQVRKIQFMALIERRNVAAQNCLQSPGGAARFAVSRRRPPEPPRAVAQVDPIVEPDVEPEVAIVEVCQEPAEALLATDHGSQVPAAEPVAAVEIASLDIPQASEASAPAVDQSPRAPPANPMFNAANFLKVLGLK